MRANAIRGEVDLVLEGETYVMRPSYEAIVAFEGLTRQPLLQLAMLADHSQLSVTQTADIVTECIKAWAEQEELTHLRRVQSERIGKLIIKEGFMAILPRVAVVLAAAASGGTNADGTPKPSKDDDGDDQGEVTTTEPAATPVVESQA